MTLKLISEKTGVSISTISRILSGKYPKCATEEVKEKVWEIARDLNYVPDLSARNLQKKAEKEKNKTICILLSRTKDTDSNYFFASLARTVNEEIVRQGCRIGELIHTDVFLEKNEPVQEDTGLVVLGRCRAETLQQIAVLTKNIVCVGLNPYDPSYDRIICDGITAAEMAMAYLLRHKHERIGYVGECSMEVRFIGYCNMLRKEDISYDSSLVYETAQTEEGGRKVAERVLKTRHMPTALFCANDETAIGLLTEMKNIQKHGPYPALISIDNICKAQDNRHLLTTINIPIFQMGSMAVKILLDRMNGGHWSPMLIQFPCNLVRRETS